jgi:6-pyruvoyltetrahydropterin/6-carboxytetrahydropterin synthase
MDPITHQVVDIAKLDEVVQRIVVRRFDHQDLNNDPEFATQTTTGENLVLLIWELLVDHVPGGRLVKVGVIETRDNYFEYSGSAKQVRTGDGVRHG